MEEFLCERRTTISYRDGDIFRKYYKYLGKEDVLLEQDFSRLAQESGINCPVFLSWGYCVEKEMFYSEFRFVEIEPINSHRVNKTILLEALDYLNKMPSSNNQTHKRDKPYEQDLLSIVTYIPFDKRSEYNKLVRQLLYRKSDVMIHGDYSFENIGWDVIHNKIIVFDFQNSGYGVNDWDRAYLLSSISNFSLVSSLPTPDIDMMKIISALRYGRAIRKSYDVEDRKKIYEYWWK
ncbi:Phosphotransferase enzyme family protein [Pseudobutyrivibrio sp. ACV-2]|uniref:phosphotransferase n=1 Tax=Pseudobutyrivibrio sp. ACV-2 TaxID=1520801 RepID=UPI0008959B06|nr:phosphotransferase [Pseudobutyrivibrio sp. ACV-2]SEA96986.1 Phosphotransferase enzyme family protein [Pseudobutyrivibrio sp. ACV-2]